MTAGGTTLLYAGGCPKCRWMSRIVVALSLGTIRRVPLEKAESDRFYFEEHPEGRGQPGLVVGERVLFGWPVFAAIPRLVAQAWWRRWSEEPLVRFGGRRSR